MSQILRYLLRNGFGYHLQHCVILDNEFGSVKHHVARCGKKIRKTQNQNHDFTGKRVCIMQFQICVEISHIDKKKD